MPILVAAAAAIVMLGSASANARSLEQTYADLCSDPAKGKSESCVALAQALVAKLQGQSGVSAATPISKSAGPDAATLAIWRKRWGVLLDMVDKEMFVVAAPGATTEVKLAVLGMGYRNKSTWKVPGEELVSTMVMADGTVQEVGGMRWDEQNQRIAVTTNGTTATSYFVTQPDGSIITETHAPSGSFRIRFYRLPDGRIQSFSEKLEAGVWVANPNGNGQSVEYSPERVAHERELVHLAEQQRVQDQLRAGQEERAAKAERSAARGAMFGAVLQGLAQGVSESNSGGYAEAQANLDATVANIQYAADVERSSQAPAQQQAPARAVDYRTEAAERATQQLPERSFIASSAPSSNSAATHSDVSAGPPNSSGPVEMFVFFVNLGGKTVAFEGPLALSRAEGSAMKARLEGEAPSRYGAGASVDARSRGGGWCAFVYQRPGDERYIMGSETTLSTATNSMKGMVNNLNAVIHHDVVCP